MTKSMPTSLRSVALRYYPGRAIGFLLGLLSLFFALESCKDLGPDDPSQLSVAPIVRTSQYDYQASEIRHRVPDTLLLNTFCRSYRGAYSDDLKRRMIDHMAAAVNSLQLSVQEFQKCLNATGQQAPGVVSLPYLAERASYTGKPCWIIEFTWGMTPDDLGHYRCFVLGTTSADTLLFITCK